MEPPTDKIPIPLDYASPSPAIPLDAFCLAALLISLVSCVFPLIAAAAITFAILGLRRRRRTGYRGRLHAVLAILLSIAGLVMFNHLYVGLRAARSVAESIQCINHLRQIGNGIAMYESTFPGASGYGWDELLSAGVIKPADIECPLVDKREMAKPGSGRRVSTSYVLLTHLEPLGQRPVDTVIAFDMNDHLDYDQNENFAGHCLNVLFADNHVESMPIVDAMRTIERSMSAGAPRPLAGTSTQQGK